MNPVDIFKLMGAGMFAGMTAVGAASAWGAGGPEVEVPGDKGPQPAAPQQVSQKPAPMPKIPMSSVTTSQQQQASAVPMARAGVPMAENEARIQAILAKYPQAQAAAPQPSNWRDPNLIAQARGVRSDYYGNASSVPPKPPATPSVFAPGSDLTTALGEAFAQQDRMKEAAAMRAGGTWQGPQKPPATPPWKRPGWTE
jgi:hypothetical protein